MILSQLFMKVFNSCGNNGSQISELSSGKPNLHELVDALINEGK